MIIAIDECICGYNVELDQSYQNKIYSKCYFTSKAECNSIDEDNNIVTTSKFLGSLSSR